VQVNLAVQVVRCLLAQGYTPGQGFRVNPRVSIRVRVGIRVKVRVRIRVNP